MLVDSCPRFVAHPSTSRQRLFYGRDTASLWTGGLWESYCMSFWWAVCPFLEIHLKNFLVKLSAVSPDPDYDCVYFVSEIRDNLIEYNPTYQAADFNILS